MYIGNMVQNTHNKVSYNSKKLRKTKKEEHIIVPNTHEPLVSKEKFDKVQVMLNERKTNKKNDEQLEFLFGGLLYCKECGRSIRISKDILKSGIRHYTQCNLYTRKGKFGVCSSHRLNYDWLEEDIVEYLQQLCEEFCRKYDFNEVDDNSEEIIMRNILEINYKLEKSTNLLNKYNNTIDNLYIDKVKGIVDENTFTRIYQKTNLEIKKLEEDIAKLEEQKRINEQHRDQTSPFARLKKSVLDYMSLRIPTKEQIMRLVERIEIDKDKKIYVYLKFPDLLAVEQ
jgi:hypothetical protein